MKTLRQLFRKAQVVEGSESHRDPNRGISIPISEPQRAGAIRQSAMNLVVKAQSANDAREYALVRGFIVTGVLDLDSRTQWAVRAKRDNARAFQWFTQSDPLPSGECPTSSLLWVS